MVIGNDDWTGRDVLTVPVVRIGEGATLVAGSVATKKRPCL
ncbi:MAG: hypothetical protein ACXV5N_09630 [Halobacteriota archaeon]